MSDEAIIRSITPIFRQVFSDDSLVVTRDLDASQVKQWDSMNHISLIVELESHTGHTVTTDELAAMANVGDLVDVLKKKGFSGA